MPNHLAQRNPQFSDPSSRRMLMTVWVTGILDNIHCLNSLLFCFLVQKGDSIASEGKGDYMYVEGRVTDLQGRPIPNAVIDTWETDGEGLYDTQVHILFSAPFHSPPQPCILSTMNVRNLIAEEDCAQQKMGRMPSARWCTHSVFHSLCIG